MTAHRLSMGAVEPSVVSWRAGLLFVALMSSVLLRAEAASRPTTSSSSSAPASPRRVEIPWPYKGFQTFPACWFGANPTGSPEPGSDAEPNTTMSIMARHQLVGWGWQQGMYDFPCNKLTAELCLQYAAQSFAVYTIKNQTGVRPSFVYRNLGGMTLAWQRLAEALNCSIITWPDFTCGFSDPVVESMHKKWFIHDPDGNICSSTEGNPGNSVSMDWQHAAPGAVQYWDEVIGGWLAEHLSPAAAVFLDVVDGLGCQPNITTHSWDQTNCSAALGGKGVDPAQLTPAMLLADSRGCLDAIQRIGSRLLDAKKALIINSGRVQPNPDGSPGRAGEHCLLPWSEFLAGVKTVPNLIWFREAWNATLELPTGLTLLREGIPKLIHYFGSADPNSTDPSVEGAMASFLVVQGPYDYFAMSSKWTDAGGMNWHNQFDRFQCGKPLTPLPTIQGTVWTREFQNCSVRYDRSLMQCGTVSGVGCGTITLKPAETGHAGTVSGHGSRPAMGVLKTDDDEPLTSAAQPQARAATTLGAAAFSPSGKTLQAFPLVGAKCLDGSTPVVYANYSSATKDWVIQIGSQSITTSFCISEKTCALFATPPATPAPPPGPMPISNAGPQSDDCTINPTWCRFNQAQISDCTMDLLMGSGAVTSHTSALMNGSAVTMHLDGAALLKASLTKLATLGLASAERVLLNGVGWGGTSVVLNVDAVGAQLKALAPSITDFRAVAADAIHPKTNHLFWSDTDGPGGNVGGRPYDALTGWLRAHYELSNPSASLLAGCKAKNSKEPWLCFYVNETLPFVKTPLYLVNQLASIWDTFCNIDGVETDSALQISCTPHGDFAIMQWHYCFQYVNHGRPRTCTAPQIIYVVKPLQEQYVNETVASGFLARPGNGAFFHSCHSGGYWVSADGPKGEWNMISVDNVTMQQAVSAWWESSNTAKSSMIQDCYWTTTSPFICNPVCATLPGPYSQTTNMSRTTRIKTDDRGFEEFYYIFCT